MSVPMNETGIWMLSAVEKSETQSWMTSDPFKPAPSSRGAVLKPLRDGEVTPCNGTIWFGTPLKVLGIYISSKFELI